MTKTFDKQFEKAKALVDGGMAVGHACRKAKIKYNTFHNRMKKLKREEELDEAASARPAKERVQKVKIEDIYEVLDEVTVTIVKGEDANTLTDTETSYSTRDLVIILGKIRTRLQRQAYY